MRLQFPLPDYGRSSVVTGAPSGGLKQHRNMFNRSNSSLQIQLHNPYFEQCIARSEVPESSNTQGIYHSYDCHKFGGQQFDEQVSMSTETNVYGRNQNGS